jgi:hypothetical protein
MKGIHLLFLRRRKALDKKEKVLLKLQYMFGPTVDEARHLGYQIAQFIW